MIHPRLQDGAQSAGHFIVCNSPARALWELHPQHPFLLRTQLSAWINRRLRAPKHSDGWWWNEPLSQVSPSAERRCPQKFGERWAPLMPLWCTREGKQIRQLGEGCVLWPISGGEEDLSWILFFTWPPHPQLAWIQVSCGGAKAIRKRAFPH